MKGIMQQNMSYIRSRDTYLREFIRKLLWQMGLRYRKNYTSGEGKPDMNFPKYNATVFIHNC